MKVLLFAAALCIVAVSSFTKLNINYIVYIALISQNFYQAYVHAAAVLDVTANKDGTKVLLNDAMGGGNSTNDGPNVNVLNANVGKD